MAFNTETARAAGKKSTRAGTPNKVSGQLRDLIAEIVETNLGQLQRDLEAVATGTRAGMQNTIGVPCNSRRRYPKHTRAKNSRGGGHGACPGYPGGMVPAIMRMGAK